jgi:DNA-binding PadR family transcriptional regulator
VTSRRGFSPQTLLVLAALREQPSQWQHGYALATGTGLKSGTLYPILIRLADQGLVEACWQEEAVPGRPRRHLYRLTADGLASAAEALAAPARPQPARRTGPASARPPARPGVVAPAVR